MLTDNTERFSQK